MKEALEVAALYVNKYGRTLKNIAMIWWTSNSRGRAAGMNKIWDPASTVR